MKAKIKALWLKALRSGKYKQTHGKLTNNGRSFCCLGVLTDLYLRETGQKWQRGSFGDGPGLFEKPGGELNTGDLSAPVMRWAGLKSADPKVWVKPDPDYPRQRDALSECNDEHRYRFPKIADLIEKYL